MDHMKKLSETHIKGWNGFQSINLLCHWICFLRPLLPPNCWHQLLSQLNDKKIVYKLKLIVVLLILLWLLSLIISCFIPAMSAVCCADVDSDLRRCLVQRPHYSYPGWGTFPIMSCSTNWCLNNFMYSLYSMVGMSWKSIWIEVSFLL